MLKSTLLIILATSTLCHEIKHRILHGASNAIHDQTGDGERGIPKPGFPGSPHFTVSTPNFVEVPAASDKGVPPRDFNDPRVIAQQKRKESRKKHNDDSDGFLAPDGGQPKLDKISLPENVRLRLQESSTGIPNIEEVIDGKFDRSHMDRQVRVSLDDAHEMMDGSLEDISALFADGGDGAKERKAELMDFLKQDFKKAEDIVNRDLKAVLKKDSRLKKEEERSLHVVEDDILKTLDQAMDGHYHSPYKSKHGHAKGRGK